MRASSITYGLLLAAPRLAVSCATGMHAIHMRDLLSHAHKLSARRERVESATNGQHADIAAELQVTTAPAQNTTHWTVAENLREMQVTDDAFNAQDLARFNHAASIQVYYQGGVVMGLADHLTDMRLLYSMFPDTAVHNHDYPLRFGEGDWTVTLTKSTGTNTGPLPGSGGGYTAPVDRYVRYDFMTIGRWEYGLLQDEYLFADTPTMYRQLGLLPDPPEKNLPDIYFDPLGSTGTDNATANKASMHASDIAFSAGSTDAVELLYSPNLQVYGLSDMPMDLDEYLQYLGAFRQAFPDIQYTEQQIIAQGEWTATVGMLNGTQTGPWTLPSYMADAPMPATGQSFGLLHYVIARWERGMIADMRVQFDIYGVLAALGVDA